MIRIVKLCKETEIAPSSLLELQKSGLFWKSRKDIYIFSAHSPQFETKQGRRPYTTQVDKCGNGFRADFIFSIVLSLSLCLWHTLEVWFYTEVFKLVSMVPSSQRASTKTCGSGSFNFLKRIGSHRSRGTALLCAVAPVLIPLRLH